MRDYIYAIFTITIAVAISCAAHMPALPPPTVEPVVLQQREPIEFDEMWWDDWDVQWENAYRYVLRDNRRTT